MTDIIKFPTIDSDGDESKAESTVEKVDVFPIDNGALIQRSLKSLLLEGRMVFLRLPGTCVHVAIDSEEFLSCGKNPLVTFFTQDGAIFLV